MEQFIIFLLGSFSVMLCVIFAMEPRSRKISRSNVIMILLTAITAVSGIYYIVMEIERKSTEDRPRVEASLKPYFSMPPGIPPISPKTYEVTFKNAGKEDATNVKIKVAATDLFHTHITRLLKQTVFEIPRLVHGIDQTETTVVENDQDFVVVCIEYSNDGRAQFRDPPDFWATTLSNAGPFPPLLPNVLRPSRQWPWKLTNCGKISRVPSSEPHATKQTLTEHPTLAG
jgi:hypothetical protein